jgi:hypothetical protein
LSGWLAGFLAPASAILNCETESNYGKGRE